MRAPSSNTARNTAKFSETRSTPSRGPSFTSAATMYSISPLSDSRSRRIRSSDRPWRPHGENDSSAIGTPSGPSASTSTHCPSVGSPSRPSAIEKPRSASVSRQASASRTAWAMSGGGMSACRRMRAVYPARSMRCTAWRTGRISRPSRLKSRTSMIASSPSSRTFRPARRYAVAPSSPAPITAGVHAYARACASQASIAGRHASGSPIGSPLARLTPATTR